MRIIFGFGKLALALVTAYVILTLGIGYTVGFAKKGGLTNSEAYVVLAILAACFAVPLAVIFALTKVKWSRPVELGIGGVTCAIAGSIFTATLMLNRENGVNLAYVLMVLGIAAVFVVVSYGWGRVFGVVKPEANSNRSSGTARAKLGNLRNFATQPNKPKAA